MEGSPSSLTSHVLQWYLERKKSKMFPSGATTSGFGQPHPAGFEAHKEHSRLGLFTSKKRVPWRGDHSDDTGDWLLLTPVSIQSLW